jgi:hypothetical protein
VWWVRRVLGRRAGRAVVNSIVAVDSLLLVARVLRRRARYPRPNGTVALLHLDCGVYKTGEQIRLVHRWFADRGELALMGFEASSENFDDAVAALADLPEVGLMHVALVGPEHTGDQVALYRSGTNGAADSLFPERGSDCEMVPARRLSQILAEAGRRLDETAVVLRMNIEGAEQFVIEDLIAAGLHHSIDGYYGMWDDLSKIDRAADDRFRRRLREVGITTLTFNDRDTGRRLRQWAIRTDIETSRRAGAARVHRTAAAAGR